MNPERSPIIKLISKERTKKKPVIKARDHAIRKEQRTTGEQWRNDIIGHIGRHKKEC